MNIDKFFLKPLSASVLLALTVNQAYAVDFEIIDLNDKTNVVTIAILGTPSFDPVTVDSKSLMFGPYNNGLYPADNASHSSKDLNGDGILDREVSFKIGDKQFQELLDGTVVQGELRGIYSDGLSREFRAYDTVQEDGDPSSSCSAVFDSEGALIAERCIWRTADGANYKPIDLPLLVSELNQGLENSTLQIGSESVVVLEAYAGKGHHGQKDVFDCTAPGGDGGLAGYARAIGTVEVLGSLSSNLYIYPGISGGKDSEGGAGTIVSIVNLASLTEDELDSTSAKNLPALGILAIAGGGGGGPGDVSDDGTQCHGGGNGGAGGTALSSTSGNATGQGGVGGGGGFGSGGLGVGGTGTPAGTGGIGGPGGLPYTSVTAQGTGGGPLWSGWSTSDDIIYSSTTFLTGVGAYNPNKGGSGGGGFGGGGAADGHNHNHKGGGGGSFAIQSTVNTTATGVSALILGNPSSAFTQQIALTIQVIADSSE